MTLSTRITSINDGGSDGWDLYRRARKLARQGEPVIELTIGEHDIGTAAPILQEMHAAAMAGHTGYSYVPGIPALREKIAARIARQSGVPTTADNVMVTTGGQGALFMAHMAILDPGDRALYIDPYYATYPGTIRAADGVPIAIRASAESGFQPDRETIAAAADGARSLMINTPNNPTGAVYSEATMAGIAEVCQSADLWLVADEVYDTQVWDGHHICARALPGMAERTLVVGSLSKSHAMTGSRVGWLCGPAAAIEAMTDLATNTTYGLPGFIQRAALFALEQGPEFEAEIGAPFRRRRDITDRLLATQNIVRASPMQGAMYALLDIRATGLSGEDFGNALLDETGIAVMPGESFGKAAAGHIRVAMTVDDARYETALVRMLEFAARRA